MENGGYYLVAAGIIAMIVELLLGVATGFDLFIIGILLIIAGAVALFSSFFIGVVTAVVLCLAYVLFGRKVVKQTLSIETKKTNIDRIIGRKALVTKLITPTHPGQVKIEGEIWRAESGTKIENGEEVEIISVTGVTLKVQKI